MMPLNKAEWVFAEGSSCVPRRALCWSSRVEVSEAQLSFGLYHTRPVRHLQALESGDNLIHALQSMTTAALPLQTIYAYQLGQDV